MKKIFISLISLILPICAFAQAGHFSFLDIEMGGGLISFYQDLQSKGFSAYKAPFTIGRAKAAAYVKGTFAGQENTQIMISSENAAVNMVLVEFPAKADWEEVTALFSQLREAFIKKYGVEPTKEKVNIEEVGGKCLSLYDVIDGVIMLSINNVLIAH